MLSFYSIHVMSLISSSLLTREDWEKMDLGSECFIVTIMNYVQNFFPLNSFSLSVYRKELKYYFLYLECFSN